jgi:hypothetical protein
VPELVRVDHRPDRVHLPVQQIEGQHADQIPVRVERQEPRVRAISSYP